MEESLQIQRSDSDPLPCPSCGYDLRANRKNQSLDDARAFGRFTAFIVALTLAASCAALLAADPVAFAAPIPQGKPATWTDDLLLPWLAGANLVPVIPAMLFLLGIHLTRIHHRLLRHKSVPIHMQDRAAAIDRK